MNSHRILIFSLNYYPKLVSGAEVAVKEITDRISASEIEFDMVTLGDGRGINSERIGNVNVHRVLRGHGFISKFIFPWVACHKAIQLHKINAYRSTWAIMASYAGWAAMLFKRRFKDISFVLTIQEGENFGRRTILKTLFKKMFKAADRIQVISNFLADWSRSMGATCPIVVVPNAVDFDHFAKPISSDLAGQLKGQLGKKDGDVFLVTASRLAPKNAVDDIIKALQYLPANVKLLILGDGVQKSYLSSLTSELKLGERVIFKGFVPHSDLPKYLQVSDIFIRPSLSEGLGNSFLEAMAAGLPVIATAVGGITDFLKDGETGLICEVNNPKSIAQKVEKLLKDGESRDYIVRQAREMVREKYRWERVVREMRKVLENNQ